MLDFLLIKNSFGVRSKEQDVNEYENAYKELVKRIETNLKASPAGDLGDVRRIREYSLVLRQVMLHRAINLFEGALSALVSENVYTMILAIRGHFETTGALGYLHKRLTSLSQGSVNSLVVDQDICALLLGGREGRPKNVPEAKSILSLLEGADETVSKHIFGGTSKQYNMLKDCYKFLCEFSHPNHHSNSIAFDLQKEKRQITMRHGMPMRDSEFNLIDNLLVCSPIFVDLFDRIGEIVP